MPTPLPSSFASAAAGQTQDPARRGDGEWSRSRTNGATQTFRRPSVATNSSHIRDSSQPASAATPTSSTYMPSQMSSNILANVLRNGDARYSKDQLLEFYKLQRESGIVGKNVEDYFVGDWDPNLASNPVNGAWGKRDDHKTSAGPEVCWDHGGNTEPLGLTDMTEAEKELFAASVNSPLKPPPTNNAKENTVPTQGGRKGSVSYTQGHINNFNTSSPTATRPGGRRRETGDSNANPMSPTAANSRFFRDEANTSTPPPALLRRKTDFRDSGAKTDERTKEGTDTASPFGSLKRSSTNPLNTSVGAVGGPSSPWGVASASASMSPMGAFGAFSLGSGGGSTPTTEKKPGYGSLRGESRFKGLLSKDSSEDIAGSAKDKNLSNLERLVEDGPDNRAQSPWADTLKTRMGRSETNPFDEPRSGSAALGGSQDVEAPSQADAGFAAFGMTSSIPGFRELMQSQESSRNATPSLLQGHEPTSPTNTNPYQSPHADRDQTAEAEDEDTDGSDIQPPQHPGLSGLRDPSNPFGSMRRVGSGVDLTGVDRSQNSSVNANRTFSGLGNLSGLSSLGGPSGWPGSGTIGTPTRERPAFAGGFGDSIFGSMGGELQSPSLSTLGGAGGLFSPHAGISGTASIGRSSKLGALFSPALHDDQGRPDSVGLEDPARQFDLQDKVAQAGKSGSHSASETPLSAMGSIPVGLSHDIAPGAQTPGGGVPSAQQRTMVMPDRMRWIYRDPQGNIQGPWTGLEMHDWFKAGFFSPDLQIKKLEDDEFEPLAQLVRRIGNSREPFLVPQIGIPHGPEPTTAQWTGNTAGSAQPPFPGSFPSFGTTLTAEQQNALERRKQEEQYLMARQKEHLAQQQAIMKSIHPGAPSSMQPQLQHQSSAHSLHSQPSFGSIASPGAYQPSPIQAPMQQQSQPGFFDSATQLRQGGLSNVGPGILSSELGGSQDQLPALLDRLNVGVGRQDPFAFGTGSSFAARQPDAMAHSQQVASMLSDRQALREEQEQFDKANANDPFDQEAREERLRQFHALRAQEGELGLRTVDGLPSHPASGSAQQYDEETEKKETANEQEPAELTLSQQVQKAASAQRQQQEQKQHSQAAPESVWGTKPDHGMPQPFPPPPSASPLPAPAAQRNRQNVAESLAAGSRSQTQTPVDAAPTSVAPWAKDTNEVPKGPSLKEIQEAEARNAAQREEVAAAARRAQLLAEQERLSQAQAQAVPGLPSSSTWASSGSPATPTSTAGSVWSNKAQPTPAASTAKKTLAQIQKEEEARKQRLAVAAASAAQTATPSPPASVGKRYADLASKAPASASTTPVAPAATGAWTTVGAGGKAKAPPAAPLGPRSASGSIPSPALSKSRPATGPRTVTLGNTPTANPNRAVEEFTKWAKLALGKGLNSNINVDDFVQQLLLLPAEAEIISDSVYANSQTLDGRRFADEFIRRRKLSDKGIVEPVSPSAFGSEQGSGGGWSEVAKKGSAASASAAAATATQREEEASNAAFKVVAPRKKGKR